jgi:DNA-binding response OmpR family regulator
MPLPNTILVVEDDRLICEMLTEKLRKEGFSVETSEDTKSARQILEKRSEDIRLLLLDIILPGENGIQFLESLRAEERYRRLAVIMLTNLDQDQQRNRALELSALDYVVKAHHTLPEIIERIKKALGSLEAKN